MAEYSKLYITNNGQALMAKMIAGSGNIDFTKVCSSSTQYTESQLQALTALSNIKQTTLVSKVARTNEVLLIVLGLSAVGWCIEKRCQHNRQPVIHTILGNQDAKDDDFQAERQ